LPQTAHLTRGWPSFCIVRHPSNPSD